MKLHAFAVFIIVALVPILMAPVLPAVVSIGSAPLDGYMTLDGDLAHYASTPNTVGNELAGSNFRIEVDVALASYTVANQGLIEKDAVSPANTRHWAFYVDGSVINLAVSTGSAVTVYASSNVGGVLIGGTRYKLRANCTPATSSAAFYYSTDGITYTAFGAPTSTAVVVNTNDNTNVLIGRRGYAASPQSANGTFYRVRAWSDTTGTTLVFDGNLNDYVSGTTWTSATTGEVWTLGAGTSVTTHK